MMIEPMRVNMAKIFRLMELEATWRKATKLLYSFSGESTNELQDLLLNFLIERRKEAGFSQSQDESCCFNDLSAKRFKFADDKDDGSSDSSLNKSISDNVSDNFSDEQPKRKKFKISEEKQMSTKNKSSNSSSSDSDVNDESNQLFTRVYDMSEFTVEMGLVCAVCKILKQENNNKLVECQECHLYYHQLCHKPLITTKEINDPRFVWYCSKCAKLIKKMNKQKQKMKEEFKLVNSSETSKFTPIISAKDAKINKSVDEKKPDAMLFNFKRNENKERFTSNTREKPSGGLSGLASLAATIISKNKTSGSKSAFRTFDMFAETKRTCSSFKRSSGSSADDS